VEGHEGHDQLISLLVQGIRDLRAEVANLRDERAAAEDRAVADLRAEVSELRESREVWELALETMRQELKKSRFETAQAKALAESTSAAAFFADGDKKGPPLGSEEVGQEGAASSPNSRRRIQELERENRELRLRSAELVERQAVMEREMAAACVRAEYGRMLAATEAFTEQLGALDLSTHSASTSTGGGGRGQETQARQGHDRTASLDLSGHGPSSQSSGSGQLGDEGRTNSSFLGNSEVQCCDFSGESDLKSGPGELRRDGPREALGDTNVVPKIIREYERLTEATQVFIKEGQKIRQKKGGWSPEIYRTRPPQPTILRPTPRSRQPASEPGTFGDVSENWVECSI